MTFGARSMKVHRLLLIGFFFLEVAVCISSDRNDLGGGIVTQTNVEQFSAIRLDLIEMEERIQNGAINDATNIYLMGSNSVPDTSGSRLSLHGLSNALSQSVLNKNAPPSYLYHLYGLTDRSTNLTDIESHSKYSDQTVTAFLIENPSKAIVAATVLNMWMYATFLLHQGLDNCYKRSVADMPEVVPLASGVDEFIALWIGKDQTPGIANGPGLYSWAQQIGSHFEKTQNIEVRVNSDLKLLYQEGRTALSLPYACYPGSSSDGSSSMSQLWSIAQRMISKATIPLMQGLVFAIANRDQELTSLYSKSLVPQTSQCRPSVYQRLKMQLLRGGSSIDFTFAEDIIADLQQVYRCLGFTCKDVGSYMGVQCEDKVRNPLAEYNPSTEVGDTSRIDLDILQVKILTSLQSFQSAKFVYLYGRNSPLPRNTENDPYVLQSLHALATSNDRMKTNHAANILDYHEDMDYSDKVVLQTLEGEGKYGSRPVEYRYEVIAKTIQYQIMYMSSLVQMAVVQDKCNAGIIDGLNGAKHSWDHVAALLIGSLEGSEEGGSLDLEDGQLSWNLANKRAHQFNVMHNKEMYAQVNNELEQFLFAGQGSLDAQDCRWFANTEDEFEQLILIPLIQSTLAYAIINDRLLSTEDIKSIAAGETFALTVLPVIATRNTDSAQLIHENMVVVRGSSYNLVQSTPQELANAFYDAGYYDCTLIGKTPDANVCAKAHLPGTANAVESFSNGVPGIGVVITVALGIMVCLGLVFWVLFFRNPCDAKDDHINYGENGDGIHTEPWVFVQDANKDTETESSMIFDDAEGYCMYES